MLWELCEKTITSFMVFGVMHTNCEGCQLNAWQFESEGINVYKCTALIHRS